MKTEIRMFDKGSPHQWAALNIIFPGDAQISLDTSLYESRVVIYRPTWQDMRTMAYALLDATGGR